MVSLTSLLSVLAAGMVLLVTVRVYSIIVNYLTARHFGLPIVITPFSWQDAFWIFARPLLPWIRGLPFGLGSWDRYSYFGWSLNDRFAMHKRLGDAFIIVSAGRNEIYIAAPETATEIVTRYRIWHKMIDVYDVFTIFGQNVMTVNGNDWQRHRKITGTAFREQNNRIVWDESLKQAGGLMSTWLRNGERTLKHLAADAMVLSMHVLSAAGFGKSYEFQNGVRKVEPGHSMSYAEATTTLLTNLVNFFIVEQLKIPAWLRTSNLRKTKQAASEFKQYMTESVAKERERLHQEHAVAGDELLSAIVHANEVAKKEEKRNSDPTKALGDEEMYGNVFIFNAAGYDTTASAISYTVPLLAANHDVQEWCGQELEALIPTGFASEVPYCETFPKLVRCCAVMYETLRLYAPAPTLTRFSENRVESLQLNDKDLTIPPTTLVTVNLSALHTDPQYWGPDALRWRPQRWIEIDPITKMERLAEPPQGAFYSPWTLGPRVCPGKKFSQVEFVAVLATLLRDHRVKPVLRAGETTDQARRRMLAVIEDSEVLVTPRIRRPEAAAVFWVPKRKLDNGTDTCPS